MTTRRGFLKLGLLGGTLLAAGGLASVLVGRDPVADRRTVLAGILPALLAGALPDDQQTRNAAVARSLTGVERALDSLPPAAQAEAAQLFALLAIAPTRIALAGITSSWQTVSTDSVSAFLARWQTHRLALLRSGYQALHDLALAAWYAQEEAWPSIGYPGPPRL